MKTTDQKKINEKEREKKKGKERAIKEVHDADQ